MTQAIVTDVLFTIGVFLVSLSIVGIFDDDLPKLRSLMIAIGVLLAKLNF